MKIKKGMEEAYKEGYNNNLDPYGHGVYTYLERWADSMEELITAGKDPEDVIKEDADRLSSIADTEGITGFMYGCAVNILSHVWEYGEILRIWHNNRYNYSGDGCVNPAIITVGD